MRIIVFGLLCVTIFLGAGAPASAQFEADPSTGGPKLDKKLVQKIRIGIEVTAEGGPCRGLHGTVAVPTDWPEQKVELIEEKTSANVKKLHYRTLGPGAKQMVVEIAQLRAGEKASAIVVFEVARSSLLPPEDTSAFKIPTKVERELTPLSRLKPVHRNATSKDCRALAAGRQWKGGLGKGRSDLRPHAREGRIQSRRAQRCRQSPDRRQRRLRRADVALHRAMPQQQHPRPHGLGPRALLPRVLPRRRQEPRTLVPLPGGGRRVPSAASPSTGRSCKRATTSATPIAPRNRSAMSTNS